MKISVIISTYNRPDALAAVLQALFEQDFSGCFEIVIADDGSKNETRELISQFTKNTSCHIKHVWHEDNGFRLAEIRNKAAASASGDYFIFLDGDTVPRKSFLKNHARLAEKLHFIAGNRILLSPNFTEDVLAKSLLIHRWSLPVWLRARFKGHCNRSFALLELPFYPRKIRKKSWKLAKGCNIAVWREDFFSVNGFDESFVGWGYEDSDFVIRLIKKNVYCKDGRFAVPVMHLWHNVQDRSREKENYAKLQQRLDSNLIRAESGVDKYLK